MSEHDVEEVLIGGVEKRDIHIVEYDSTWPLMFAEHSAKVSAALGSNALRVEHIGSTSVPSLPAKAIVDMLLVVRDSAREETYLPLLEAAGYELRVRDRKDNEHRMLRTSARHVHIHVYSVGAAEIDAYLAFREALRSSEAERTLYAETKRRLSAQDWPDVNAYAAAKTNVIMAILARARNSRG